MDKTLHIKLTSKGAKLIFCTKRYKDEYNDKNK